MNRNNSCCLYRFPQLKRKPWEQVPVLPFRFVKLQFFFRSDSSYEKFGKTMSHGLAQFSSRESQLPLVYVGSSISLIPASSMMIP